jgi:hypothetical protein
MKKDWNNITIREYQEIVRISNDVALSDIEMYAKIITCLYGVPYEQVMQMTPSQLLDYDISFLKTKEPEFSIPQAIDINDRHFKVVQFVKDLKTGQFIDMQLILSKCKDERDMIENFDKIISCFLLNESGRYESGIDCKEVLFSQGYPILFFFTKFKKKLETITLRYLEKQEKKIAKEILATLK